MGRSVVRPLSVEALAQHLGARFIGNGALSIRGVANLESAGDGDLTFFADAKHRAVAAATKTSVLIVRDADVEINNCTRIVHAAPHAAFAAALAALFPASPVLPGTSLQAVVDGSAQVSFARVDAFVHVGENSRVGSGTHLHPGVSVGAGVVIGRDCIIYPGAQIYSGVQMGDRCIVHSGAVIGSDGFGFQPSSRGWQKVPQVGAVIVGDDVEIGANTTIDRGAIEDTVIGNGVKIDNLVQIAHNCRIGDHTAIAGCAGVAGSTTIGARCMIGGAAMIVGHLTICDDVVISGGTLVSSPITAPGRYTGVFPSTEHKMWTKIAAGLRRSGK